MQSLQGSAEVRRTRALKGREGVNPETKERILKIAEEHNYKPNLIGKALVYSNRSVPVTVIMNSIGNSFFEDVKKECLPLSMNILIMV